jgi:hypothetical protein
MSHFVGTTERELRATRRVSKMLRASKQSTNAVRYSNRSVVFAAIDTCEFL